jgi:thiol-disulfide isomerase/thioredoxin
MRTRKTESMPSARATGIAIRAFSALCAIFALTCSVGAAELVMYRRDGCPYCARWDREIGPIYSKTEISRRAPIRMINLDRDRDLPVKHGPIIFTPTFVLVENGKEVGRMEGYTGDEFFWVRLANLVAMLPQPAPKGASVRGEAVASAERLQ